MGKSSGVPIYRATSTRDGGGIGGDCKGAALLVVEVAVVVVIALLIVIVRY